MSLVLVTLMVSYFSLVLGELVPKRVAMQKSESISFAVIGILSGISTVMRPFVKLLSVSTNIMVRLFGLNPDAVQKNVTEEEIRMMVDVGGEKGVIENAQKEMINNIFEFDDITAGDIMTPVPGRRGNRSHRQHRRSFAHRRGRRYSRLPVYQEEIDNIVGVLYVKDLLPMWDGKFPRMSPSGILCGNPILCPTQNAAAPCFAEMTEKRMQMAMVVDEYGGFAGIVTMEDCLNPLSEIFRTNTTMRRSKSPKQAKIPLRWTRA